MHAPCTRQVLRCIEEPKDAQALSSLTPLLFKHDWCYRPQEMTSAWYEVERGPKPRRGTEPWCSWGFADPAVPGVCAASGGAWRVRSHGRGAAARHRVHRAEMPPVV